LETPDKKDKKGKETKGGKEARTFFLQELAEFLKEGNYKLTEAEVI